MTGASRCSCDQSGEAPERCDGCGESLTGSQLLPIGDGSIRVCEKCYTVATAMVSTRKDS